MKVLICGDRNWNDRESIRALLRKLQDDTSVDTVIEGEARGADTIAREEATKLGLNIESYPAEWHKYGKGAGPIRNKQMLDQGKPALVVYFHKNLAGSKGTRHMVNYARSKGILVHRGG